MENVVVWRTEMKTQGWPSAIKKTIKTQLFIDERAALYKQKECEQKDQKEESKIIGGR